MNLKKENYLEKYNLIKKKRKRNLFNNKWKKQTELS